MKQLVCLISAACLLAQQPSRTVPVMGDVNLANLPIQKIGSNDLLAIAVYDAPELSRPVRVSADGEIRLPMLQQKIPAEGLLPGELESRIAAALREEKLIVDPFVTVTVMEYNSRPISVMGAVRRPITFQAMGQVTLLDALARAEGLAADAGQEILLSRARVGGAPGLVERIRVKDLINEADPAANVRLTGGEEIRVPDAEKIYVLGNVKKPGAFALQDAGEGSVLKSIALAEGLTSYVSKQAFIYRREGGNGARNEIPIEIDKIMARKSPDVSILPNDILYIPDAKGTRARLAALEKFLLFGSGVTSALIYAGVR